MDKRKPFQEEDSYSFFSAIRESLLREIDRIESQDFLRASPSELERHYLSRARVVPLALRSADRYIEQQRGTTIEVVDGFRPRSVPSEPAGVKGTALAVAVPYDGDRRLWRVSPSTFTHWPHPDIEVRPGVVVFTCQFRDDSPDGTRLKGEIESSISHLADAARNLGVDVERYNAETEAAIKSALESKRTKSLKAIGAVESLGIPIRRLAEGPTFAIPVHRREPPIPRPAVTAQKFEAEPMLEEREFRFILGVLRSMSLVIERSPQTFCSLDEEAIRNHFLIQLNGHYEGGATGETFNAAGKTDILIRSGDRNVFIAECKFWRGQMGFDDAIEQLLGYLSWRDSKCALLVFNQNKDSTAVRTKMHEVMSRRSELRKVSSHEADGDSYYVLVKSSDPGRDIHVCTMLFDIPTGKG